MNTPQPPTAEPLAPLTGSADSLSAELERIRAEKKPTRRGILVCGQVMGQMLQIGWHKDQLDALELMFWLVRDADGRVIKNPPNDPSSATRRTGRDACNHDAPAGFAAAHG